MFTILCPECHLRTKNWSQCDARSMTVLVLVNIEFLITNVNVYTVSNKDSRGHPSGVWGFHLFSDWNFYPWLWTTVFDNFASNFESGGDFGFNRFLFIFKDVVRSIFLCHWKSIISLILISTAPRCARSFHFFCLLFTISGHPAINTLMEFPQYEYSYAPLVLFL